MAESGQPFRAPRFRLRVLQTAIGFGEAFSQIAIQLGLMLTLLREAVDDHGSKKEKQDAQREVADSLGSQFVFLHRGIEIRAVGGRRKQRPEHRQPRATVKCRGDDRQIIDGIVTAVDSDFFGVIEKQGRQQDLEQDDVEDSSCGKAGDQLCLQQLHNSDGEENQLLVPFELWREHRQSEKEEEPDDEPGCIEAVKPPGLRIENLRRKCHAASIQPQNALLRQLDGGFLRGWSGWSGGAEDRTTDIRISNHRHK